MIVKRLWDFSHPLSSVDTFSNRNHDKATFITSPKIHSFNLNWNFFSFSLSLSKKLSIPCRLALKALQKTFSKRFWDVPHEIPLFNVMASVRVKRRGKFIWLLTLGKVLSSFVKRPSVSLCYQCLRIYTKPQKTLYPPQNLSLADVHSDSIQFLISLKKM